MCVQVLPKHELLFERGVNVHIHELLEQQQQHINIEHTREIKCLMRILNFIILSLPYVFMVRSTFIYVDTYREALIIIMNSSICGMIITINQLHNKKTPKYWVLVLITCLVLHYKCVILIYIVPEIINYQINEKNNIITALTDIHGIIVGNNIYWTFITWVWFVILSIFTNNNSGFSIHSIS
jgi:hypothetical protein